MKLAILLQHYFPYGGLQRDALRLAEEAAAAGDEPSIIVSTWTGTRPDGIHVTELHSGGSSNHGKVARFAQACQCHIRSENFDTSICFSRVPGAAFHFCGDPCYADKFHRNKPGILRWLPRYRFLLKNESAIFGAGSRTHLFFLAESEIPAYQEHYPIPGNRMTLLPPWLRRAETWGEPHDVIRSSVRRSLGLPADCCLLLFVGSDFRRKGLDLIISSLAATGSRSHHLLVCGQSNPESYRKQAKGLGISGRVHFLGPRDDIPRLMTAANLLVHPARQETAGMVLLEALTYGLPVLCTENCGYSVHVREVGCPLLKAGVGESELSRSILSITPDLPQLGQRALAWSQDPSRYRTAELILQTMRRSL